jgi:hypothetical protein
VPVAPLPGYSSDADEVLAELKDSQAVLAALQSETDSRISFLLSLVTSESVARSLPAAVKARRADRRVWAVFAADQRRK